MHTVERHINDFGLIGLNGRAFYAEHCIQIGGEHRSWLEDQLAQETELPTVVVTHFAPTLKFRNQKFSIDDLTAYFCNDYEDLIKHYKPEYWFYGHTHFNMNTLFENTYVMSNQRGYGEECLDYRPDWLIDIHS